VDLGPAWSLGIGPTAAARLVSLLGRRARPARVRLLRAVLQGAVAVQVPHRAGPVPVVTAGFVDAVHAAGAEVHVWTVDDPSRMRRLLDLGVDALVTNRADLALAVTAGARRPREPSSERQPPP
jgi:glycerophosphoryl diester phosphodiesterase